MNLSKLWNIVKSILFKCCDIPRANTSRGSFWLLSGKCFARGANMSWYEMLQHPKPSKKQKDKSRTTEICMMPVDNDLNFKCMCFTFELFGLCIEK